MPCVNLSIIIPTLNEQHYLPTLLNSIAEQKYDATYEVIIVDGHSIDKTKELAATYTPKFNSLTIIDSEPGISKQRNKGAEAAKYENIIFIDADMLLMPHTLNKLATFYAKHSATLASPRFLPYDGKVVDYVFAHVANAFMWLRRHNNPIACGMCIMTTKSIHRSIGGFDESLIYAEDIDYGLRAFRSHIPFTIASTIVLKSSTRRAEKMGRINLVKAWMSWYADALSTSTKQVQDKATYEFGNFKK